METLQNWLWSLCWSAFDGFDKTIMKSTEVLTDGLVMNGWDQMLEMSEYLKPFCSYALGIVVMYEIWKTYSRFDSFKWENLLTLGIKIIFSKACIDIVPSFLKACYLQSQQWIFAFGTENTKIGENIANKIYPLIMNTDGFFAILGMFLTTFIMLLAVKVCGLIIHAIAFGRIFEIFVYLVISPFPCIFIPLGNGDGSGISNITVRFLKSFIAVCLQGVIMLITIKVFGMIMTVTVDGLIANVDMNDTSAALTELIFTMLLGSVALVMSIIKGGTWAKNLIDTM